MEEPKKLKVNRMFQFVYIFPKNRHFSILGYTNYLPLWLIQFTLGKRKRKKWQIYEKKFLLESKSNVICVAYLCLVYPLNHCL